MGGRSIPINSLDGDLKARRTSPSKLIDSAGQGGSTWDMRTISNSSPAMKEALAGPKLSTLW